MTTKDKDQEKTESSIPATQIEVTSEYRK